MKFLDKLLVAEVSIKQCSEIELLLCCSRTHISFEYAEHIRNLVSQNIDWNQLLQIARLHGVLPLLYWQLKDICPDSVPTDVLEQLRRNFETNAQKNLALTAELVKLIKLFQKNGIPIIPFKGAILASFVYKKLTLREFIDIDILIPEQFIKESSNLLNLQGYKSQFKINDAHIANYAKINNEQTFWHKDKQVTVDLHWELLPKPFNSYAALAWSRNEQVYLKNTAVQSINIETLLLYLCAHGTKHSWSHLKFLCDIAELISSHPDLDWHWIEAQSEKLGNKQMLLLGLYLCQELFGTVLPAHLVQQLQTSQQIKTLASQVQQKMVLPQTQINNVFEQRDIYIRTLSVKDKLWFYFRVFMAPTALELTMVSLPVWLFYLYYLVRPIRLLIKYTLAFSYNPVFNGTAPISALNNNAKVG
ncbi:MAG TPA: nucleotidyltransferase family protein [Candidatus Obscuribacterales bacterium]